MENENYKGAIDLFQKALSLVLYHSDATYIDSLANAHYESGNFKGAEEQLRKITSLTSGLDRCWDVFSKAFYKLGLVYEQQGDSAKAIEHYEKFLDLWKDADPGISEVEDARKWLGELKR